MKDKPNSNERRRLKRRNVSYYLPVMERQTGEVVGHLVDISPVGFKMDTKESIPSNKDYELHLDFMEELAGRASFDFNARSKWCHPDPIQPYLYNAGFEIIGVPPDDLEILKIIQQKYGSG